MTISPTDRNADVEHLSRAYPGASLTAGPGLAASGPRSGEDDSA